MTFYWCVFSFFFSREKRLLIVNLIKCCIFSQCNHFFPFLSVTDKVILSSVPIDLSVVRPHGCLKTTFSFSYWDVHYLYVDLPSTNFFISGFHTCHQYYFDIMRILCAHEGFWSQYLGQQCENATFTLTSVLII